MSQRSAQDFIQIRRRVGRNQQDAFPCVRQSDRSRTGDRCLADSAFAREEKIASRLLKKFHGCVPDVKSVCGVVSGMTPVICGIRITQITDQIRPRALAGC
jgi:hypothetical protein